MADDSEPFYSAYGKISSRFGGEDGEKLAEELTAADIGPDGPQTATAKVKTAPNEDHKLVLYVERCTAPRPTTSLKGSLQRYEEACASLEYAFLEQFSDGAWSQEQLDFSPNPPPDKSPFTYLPAAEAAQYQGRLGTLAAPTYLQEMGATTHRALTEGRMIIDASIYPPQLVRYPRIGAFEVTYQLTDQGRPIAQKLVYSKLAVGVWPNMQALAKKIQQCVQLDLHKQRLAFASNALRSKALAEKQRELVAKAEEDAAREQQEVEEAARELSQAETELHAARERDDADAIVACEAALAKMRSRFEVERRESREAAKALNALIVQQAETLARAEVSEARLAMQEARKELAEWEASQRELEAALENTEALTRMGDSTGSAAMRHHANRLRELSDKELAEVRAANVSATTELVEAVGALHKAAEAKLAACDNEGSEDSAAATGHGSLLLDSAQRRNALKAIAEANIQIEDAEAQAAMTTADLEFREATSFVLQARLASSEAKHAAEGDAAAALEKAAALQKRAYDEIVDAREALEKAAIEAVEAAEARNDKEIAEAEETKEELSRAEAALEAAKVASMREDSDKSPEGEELVKELTLEVEALRLLVERENKDLVAAALNVDMTRSELDAKRADIELSLYQAYAAARKAEKAQHEGDLTVTAEKELLEAEMAEARLERLLSELRDAQEEAAVCSLRADELVRDRGAKNSASKSAMQAEAEAHRKMDWLKHAVEEAETTAQRERLEADLAIVAKEEAEAMHAYDRYMKIGSQVESMRERLQAAIHHAEQAQASGERALEERAAEAASKLQIELDRLSEEAKVELDTATREQEEASQIGERVEVQQAMVAEVLAARAVNAVEDAETEAAVAEQALTKFKAGVMQKSSEFNRLTALVEHMQAKHDMARTKHAEARTKMEVERGEAADAAVSRAQKVAEFAELRHELAADTVMTLELRVSAAARKAHLTAEAGHVILSKNFEGQLLELTQKLKAAHAEVDEQAKRAADAKAAAAAAQRKKEVEEAQEFRQAAIAAEAAAARAESDAQQAAAAFAALTNRPGRGNPNAKKLAEAEAVKKQTEAKALRLREEATRVRVQADKEAADLAAL